MGDDSFRIHQLINLEHQENGIEMEKYFRMDDKYPMPKIRKSMSIGNLVLFNEQSYPEQKPLNTRYPSLENVGEQNSKEFVNLSDDNTKSTKILMGYKGMRNLQETPVDELSKTVLESPASHTKLRQRPVHILYEEERNTSEIERSKFKARSVSKNLFDEPKKVMTRVRKKGCTMPKPFSFDLRDKMIQQKREMMIKKVLDEERKARIFHANPVSKSIKNVHGLTKSLEKVSNGRFGSNMGSAKKKSPNVEPNHFKAKPPIVLYKEPFVPVKTIKVTKIEPFYFHTDLREAKRAEFKFMIEEKERHLACLKEAAREEQLKIEQEEIAKLRKQAEFKAHPVRKYPELIIKPSNKVTEPISFRSHLSLKKSFSDKGNTAA